MNHLVKERIKTILIYILMLTGLLQVGILWSYQNQGTPTGFLTELFNTNPKISDETAIKNLFIPKRLTLSDGDNSHFIINTDNNDYEALWQETLKGLKEIASGKSALSKVNENWGDIIERRGYLVDFGYNLKPDLLSWFLGMKITPKDFPDINKIMIKNDVVDEDMNVLYLYSSDGSIYSSAPILNEKDRSLMSIVQSVDDNEEQKYRKYYTFSGANKGKPDDGPDVLYVTSAPRFWPYPVLSVRTPDTAKSEDNLATVLLGNEKDRYTKSHSSNLLQFSFSSNLYRYYSDGYLNYRYLGNADSSGKGNIGNSLLNAYRFIDRIRPVLSTSPDIILSSISYKGNGTYSFGFDYKVDKMLVKMNMAGNDEEPKLTHAISILADSKRVLRCDWLLKDFQMVSIKNYNDRLFDLLDNSEKNFNDINVKDISIGYYLDSINAVTLNPALLIEQTGKDDIYLNMVPETGD